MTRQVEVNLCYGVRLYAEQLSSAPWSIEEWDYTFNKWAAVYYPDNRLAEILFLPPGAEESQAILTSKDWTKIWVNEFNPISSFDPGLLTTPQPDFELEAIVRSYFPDIDSTLRWHLILSIA